MHVICYSIPYYSQSSGSRNDSEESAEKTRAIDMKLRAERTKESQICKLLLLGGGESGKSTLFKQVCCVMQPDRHRIFGYSGGITRIHHPIGLYLPLDLH